MSIILGIDLGTSTTECAIYKDDKPVMIPNEDEKIIIPSAVGVDDFGNWVIGERAASQFLLSPERTAIEIKRKIGTNEPIVIDGKKYTAVELSTKILEYVKAYAEEYVGEEIDRAVISVPAYFNDIQRNEVIKAGMGAGLDVERILNEPTAAALSYGLDHMEEESHILVYDLGGGTFDVTLLEMFEGVLDVKASSGDNQLGGKDFDEKLMNHMTQAFKKKHNVDLLANKFALVKLKTEAEACKKSLSSETSYRVMIPAIIEKNGEPLALDMTITREEFEELSKDLIQRTHHPIDVVLKDSQLSPTDIDRVILVGGSTRMPLVFNDIVEYLDIEPGKSVNPDYAVAEGAAIMAGIINNDISHETGLIITDVNPYTLGIRSINGFDIDHMSVLIKRNVTIPTTKSDIFYTAHDYQTNAIIEVYQGESKVASNNHFLGKFEIGDIPPKYAGMEAIDVQFSYNLNGILEVQAKIVSTGNQASINIDLMGNNSVEDDEPGIDLEAWKDAEAASDYRALIRRAERSLKKGTMDSQTRKKLEDALNRLKRGIIEEDDDLMDEAEKDVKDNLSQGE